MTKSSKKNKKSTQKHTAEPTASQTLAEQVADSLTGDEQIIAEVDIDNTIVSDVLIVRDAQASDASDDSDQKQSTDTNQASEQVAGATQPKQTVQADHYNPNDNSESETVGHDDATQPTPIKQQVLDAALDAKAHAESLKQDAEHATKQTLHALNDKKAQLQETLTEAGSQAKEQLEQISTQIKSLIDDAEADLTKKSTTLKQDVLVAKEALVTDAQSALLTGAAAVHDQLTDAKDKLEQGKDTVTAKVQAWDDQLHASQKISELTDNIKTAGDDIKQGMDRLQTDTKAALESAKSTGDTYQQAHANKGIAAKVATLGAYLSGLGKTSRPKHYTAVNIHQQDFDTDAFHAQGGQMLTQLFGAKAATAQSLAAKVVPQSRLDAMAEVAYETVAQWAQKWAMTDLQKHDRFDQLANLDAQSRHAWLEEVVNQNRALATLGGIAGLAGLKGVVFDTAWLLMISLRTVYQVAAVSGEPLTGKQGIKQAYGVLSGANLQRLQEKQVLLTALALGQGMLKRAQETGIESQLHEMGSRYKQSEIYTKQFAELNRLVDLDRFNPSWLNKLLPILSVGVGVYYNQDLIDEVIGTAIATFAPTQQLAQAGERTTEKLDDKTSDLSSN